MWVLDSLEEENSKRVLQEAAEAIQKKYVWTNLRDISAREPTVYSN